MRTRIKICGITSPEDGVAAALAGVDAIGLVFYDKSPRAVSLEQAQLICGALPPFIQTVGLFVDADADAIRQTLQQVPIDMIQFHGDECSVDCGIFGRPYIKAITMHEGVKVEGFAATYRDAAGFLLDAHADQARGGTGQSFDWSQFPQDVDKPLILAGGLTPENVFEAVRQTRPYAVDVSSGVEIDKGIKDAQKIIRFVEEVRRADAE
ncbi:MAG: phosphoribosylanthranilate isomerase [Gammaproteobacteria bacterium]|nr:phosphoribosylanthranilate isomerase [Gammaproteobacteria bacterium]